jgi:hypothetical protein
MLRSTWQSPRVLRDNFTREVGKLLCSKWQTSLQKFWLWCFVFILSLLGNPVFLAVILSALMLSGWTKSDYFVLSFGGILFSLYFCDWYGLSPNIHTKP